MSRLALPKVLRQELGVKEKRPYKKPLPRAQRPQTRKRRKLYQSQPQDAQDDIDDTPDRNVRPLPKTAEERYMEQDDAEIDYWEAKLGNRQKSAGGDELGDGLDDLFEGLDLPRGPSKLEEESGSEQDESGSEGDMAAFEETEDFAGFESEEETRPTRPSIYKPFVQDGSEDPTTKYVPPALRNKAPQAANTEIRRHLNGLLNKLSSANIATIVSDIEALYRSHPRGSVNEELTSLIINVVSDKSGLLESFVVLHAAIVAAIYKTHGVDFAASFTQTLVELILNDEQEASKRMINLMTLVIELYNYNVIASTLLFDFVKLLISTLSETNSEILLTIVRSAGSSMRKDDPAALKDILIELNAGLKAQYHEQGIPIPTRMRFMVDAMMDLKNNKPAHAESQQAKELRTRMRKFIGGLNGGNQTSSEPLRVSLDDIRNVASKGKWWLIGASWRQEARNEEIEQRADVQDANSDLLELARKHRLNNPIRKQIFVTLLSASDYMEAISSVLSLRLKKAQESEICRVLLLLVGSEEHYNPYYTFIAKGLSEKHNMRLSLQFCLWDFLKECGEVDGDSYSSDSTERPSMRKLVNVGKFYGSLVGMDCLSLTILKTLTFARLQPQTKILLDVLMTELFMTVTTAAKKAAAAKPSKNQDRETELARDEKLTQIFGAVKKFDAESDRSGLKDGLDWFLRKTVIKATVAANQDDARVVKLCVETARIVLSS